MKEEDFDGFIADTTQFIHQINELRRSGGYNEEREDLRYATETAAFFANVLIHMSGIIKKNNLVSEIDLGDRLNSLIW